ncbi:hypothetical protein [Aeromonas caviae]|uniref:hypothetical protein n=1 Tax=Aeromonas caviae TaxID=648 RepID=UPI003F748814
MKKTITLLMLVSTPAFAANDISQFCMVEWPDDDEMYQHYYQEPHSAKPDSSELTGEIKPRCAGG